MREMIAPQSSLDANPKAKLYQSKELVSNPFQVRQDFDSPEAVAALEELAADITENTGYFSQFWSDRPGNRESLRL